MTQQNQVQMPFQYGWFSFELPGYRDCASTYELYPYESIPPISEELFDGTLQWLTPLDERQSQLMQLYQLPAEERAGNLGKLDNLVRQTQQLGLTLPSAFLRLMSSQELQDQIPSCTACYFDLPEKILPCPGSKTGYIIRFLNDQQDVLLWYLYLTPEGEHCVLVTPLSLDELTGPEYEEQQAQIAQHIFVCAPTFESFIYRFWIENTLWDSLEVPEALSADQRRYLAHYAQN